MPGTVQDDQSAHAALRGLRVLDLSTHLAGAHATQLFADFGAEVIQVEPPGGSILRSSPSFPFLARGKSSVVADLARSDGRRYAAQLAAEADVVVESFRPGTAERLGLGYDDLAAANPGLVYVSISGFGTEGPYARVKGYEALVMANIGGHHALAPLVERDGPAFGAVPFCSFSAAQSALQGALSALWERERSGRGQHVQTSLVHGIAAHDPWNWFLHFIIEQYPDAFVSAPHVADGVPNSALVYRLLIGLSEDGEWLQFSQTARHLYEAMMRTLDLGWMLDHPDWKGLPVVEDPRQRVELWNTMLERVRARSAEEWAGVFDREPNVWAERFRSGPDVLEHPQLQFEGASVVADDPVRGAVLQPGPLARLSRTPADVRRPAPSPTLSEVEVHWTPRPAREPVASADVADAGAPLAGVTILELGMYYAGPFAGSLLADLGARVIKVEPLTGDPMREIASFPEVGAIKVLQGKETVAVDIATDEGRRLVRELAARSDIVLQSFRAGVAERLGVDAASLMADNPDLVYVSCGGYGADGPCARRPAYAPTIAAASGLALRLSGDSVREGAAALDLEDVKQTAVRLITATNASFAQCDGLGALGTATAALLGLLAARRGAGGQQVFTSMLNTAVHANCEDIVAWDGKPTVAAPDSDLHGLNALYRLYRAADAWVFLAAPQDREWDRLVTHPDLSDLGSDRRFGTAAARHEADAELAEELGRRFAGRSAREWETELLALDVGCLVANDRSVESVLQSDDFGRASGLVVDVDHPMLGTHPRLTPLVRFSRSSTHAGPGTLLGQHTRSVLKDLGYSDPQIDDLVSSNLVAAAD